MYLIVDRNTLSLKRLNDLPREIFVKIMMDWSYRDVKAVSKTCRRLSSICESILECKRKVVEIRARGMEESLPASRGEYPQRGLLGKAGLLDWSEKLGHCRFLDFSNDPGQHVNTDYGNQMEDWALKVGGQIEKYDGHHCDMILRRQPAWKAWGCEIELRIFVSASNC